MLFEDNNIIFIFFDLSTFHPMQVPSPVLCINLFGNRITTIIGGVLVFIGFSASYVATSLDFMLLTYGLIAGTCVCLVGVYRIVNKVISLL